MHGSWASCTSCLNDNSTENCCYKMTHCVSGAVQYSTDSLLDSYVGSVIRLSGGICYEVERSFVCNSPVSIVPHASPGPYADCAACSVPSITYYKLINCNDASDIVYTENGSGANSTALIDTYYAANQVLKLSGECFCREIHINPTGPQGTEASQTITSVQIDCANCKYYIRLQNCVTGAIVQVDYATSPTVVAAAGGTAAHEITVGGSVPDPVNKCWQKLVGCLGPTQTVYPIGVVTASYAAPNGCTDCATAGQTCVKVSHCCGTSYVADQIVNVTTGITAADVGQVVQADITVGATVYTGCWEVSANGDCVGVLPDADVNAINTATVGSGNMPDCTYCVVDPCPPQCVLLESCQNPGSYITVDGATGATIGPDVVEFAGYADCYKQCNSQGNPIAGNFWFFGERLGIDFSTGVPVADFNGMSDMLYYNSTNTAGSDAYTFRGAAVHCATGSATIGGHAFAPGDLMFYTDGHWIYDRTHTKINLDTGATHQGNANYGLVGHNGKTFPAQGAVIIPNAAGDITNGVWHQYYVIQNSCNNGPIKWSIVDMTLNSGKGEVLDASDNTTLVANACEFMCLSTTTGIGSAAYWHLFFVPVMANATDWANSHIKAIKFSSGGIGAAFVSIDLPTNYLDTSTAEYRCTGELGINQMNNILGLRYMTPTASTKMLTVAVNPTTALSSTAAIGFIQSNGYNGGANNGTWHSILSSYQDPIAGASTNIQGFVALDNVDSFAFSPDGTKLWTATNDYYDPADPYNAPFDDSGFSLMVVDVYKYAVELMTSGWSPAVYSMDPVIAASPTYYGWFTRNFSSGSPSQTGFKMFPDASSASGWYGNTDEDRCSAMVNDIAFGPDGKLWMNVVEQQNNDAYAQAVGAGAQVTNSVVRLDNPNADPDYQAAHDNLFLVTSMPAYDLGSRRMGERFPVWLQMPCPCDPANNVPVTITTTHTDCSDCAPPPNICYKLTECECTGGTTGTNPCSVNDPATMPPNMVTYGKSWSPVCQSGNPKRWQQIVDAVQLLGTSGSPGVAQTVTFTYSFINGGAIFPTLTSAGYTGFGPTLACEQGPGTANPTGISASCAVYNKTYTINFTQFRAEMATMFGHIKDMFEAVFNTNCGYGANLTINFTDLGYETGYTAADPADANITNPGNGTSFTDVNGVAGIGDLRIGFSDFGIIDPAGGSGCGVTGGASGILGLCFNSNLNANIPGINKVGPLSGMLLFDSNEDWRKSTDAVTGNSFSLIRVGIHEILHALGYGHDFLSFGGACNSLCTCPCYQSDPGCPNIYSGACPGMITNNDALMGAFSSNNAFLTDFPGGLVGPNGIYDRRATCGIYGNPDANYGCQDGVCLGNTGCVYVTEYSDDPALAGYVGGIIEWDNGDAAGLRCWEVDIESPCPSGVSLVNPVNLVGGDPAWDCTNCTVGPTPCWELNICACDTSSGAPAQIITSTDLSQYCDGTVGNGTVIEISAHPGTCYEINCTPVSCPAAAPPITITNSYAQCLDCCQTNQTCYQLCECNSTSSTGNCNGVPLTNLTLIQATPFTGATWGDQLTAASEFISTPGNTFDNVDVTTLKFASTLTQCSSSCCELAGHAGSQMHQAGGWNIQTVGGPNPYSLNSYTNFTDLRNATIALGVTGVTVTDTYNSLNTKLTAWYAGLGGGRVSAKWTWGVIGCSCTSASGCVVVTNDLSAQLGQVVTLAGSPPAPLSTNTCYEVQVCGTCGVSCTPIVAVTINTIHPDCPDCISNPGGCTCYRLVDCTDPNIIINNVCQTTDLDTHYGLGNVIQINGNVAQCWKIECEDPSVCDPATCV